MSFLDAYSGYNQISLFEEDQIHTAFVTEWGLYYYKHMPFGLKNAGATYQRLMNKMFAGLLGKTMEVYIDDMVVKSKKASDHLRHLTESFQVLRHYRMRLNPKKCAFGVSSGQFLGHIVSRRGIEANPTQLSSVAEIQRPSTIRDIQRLTGKIATLSRFVSKMSDRCKPFF